MQIRTNKPKGPTTYIQFRQKGLKKTKTITVAASRDAAVDRVLQSLTADQPTK